MANLQNVNLSEVMHEISKIAPIALIVCAALSFISVGVFCVDYYEELFKVRFDNAHGMAVLVAVIQEAVRFALLVASIRDFSDKKPLNGWLGLFGSGVLVWHDMNLAESVAKAWSADNPDPYVAIFYFLILIGLLLEVRLILTVQNSKSSATSQGSEVLYSKTKNKPVLNGKK